MASKPITISVPEEMLGFLDENPDLSPSKLLQSKILEMQERIKFNPELIEAKGVIQKINKARDIMQRDIQTKAEFITMKGNWEEYVRYADTQEKGR